MFVFLWNVQQPTCGSQKPRHLIFHCSGSCSTCCSALHTGSKNIQMHVLFLPAFNCSQVWFALSLTIKPVLPAYYSLLTGDSLYTFWTAHYSHLKTAHGSNVWAAQRSTVLRGCTCPCPLDFPKSLSTWFLTISRVCETQAVHFFCKW